eukprot:TRINITY_DN4677_c0_g1_i2.p1 TRINITY_DN4677_c0_g1~~TRINITY_DN4677_c0_g1_i2.p1  ORF type:complete len:330 (+),score=24.61 TRINITY_DN4677_c0_g1_i2:95-991(+)
MQKMVDFSKFLFTLFFVQVWFLQSSVGGQYWSESSVRFMSSLGLCDTTRFGCKCKESYEVGGQEYSGCINPRMGTGRSKLPWCEVEDSCWQGHLSLVGNMRKNIDFCFPGCEFVKEEEDKKIIEQEETIFGCKCSSEWYYGNQKYSGCANPDNDPRGSWCAVEQSCPITLHYYFFINSFFFVQRINMGSYCLQKDEDKDAEEEPTSYQPIPVPISRTRAVSSPSPSPKNISVSVLPYITEPIAELPSVTPLNTSQLSFSSNPASEPSPPLPNPHPTPPPAVISSPLPTQLSLIRRTPS